MSQLTITGTIKIIGETQTFGSGFTKREFIITTADSKFPQDIKFEAVKERCDLLDAYAIGQQVTTTFDVLGNEYNGKYYVNLRAWKIQPANSNQQQQPPQQQSANNPTNEKNQSPPPAQTPDFNEEDNIPF